MAKTKKPKKEDYEKQSKEQGLGSLVSQGASSITNVNNTTTRTTTNG